MRKTLRVRSFLPIPIQSSLLGDTPKTRRLCDVSLTVITARACVRAGAFVSYTQPQTPANRSGKERPSSSSCYLRLARSRRASSVRFYFLPFEWGHGGPPPAWTPQLFAQPGTKERDTANVRVWTVYGASTTAAAATRVSFH